MRNKIILGIIVLILIAFLIFFSKNQNPKNDLVIGAVLAKTGSAASYGEWAKNGIEIAIDDANKRLEKTGRKVVVLYEDSQSSPKEAVSAYFKLVSSNNVKNVITMLSGVAMAIKPLAEKDEVIQMEMSATTPDYSSPDDMSFRVGVTAFQLAKKESELAYDFFNSKKIAVLYINNEFGNGMKDKIKEYYKGEIVVEVPFEQSASDFRTNVLKLKQNENQIDMIILVGHLKESGLLVRQLRENDIKTKILSDVYTVKGQDFLQGAKDYANGIIFVDSEFNVNQSELTKKFNEEYRKRYNEDAPYYAAQAYDSVMSIVLSNEKCGNNKCVKRALEDLSFEGVSGKIDFDNYGDVDKKLGLRTIEKGLYVEYNK